MPEAKEWRDFDAKSDCDLLDALFCSFSIVLPLECPRQNDKATVLVVEGRGGKPEKIRFPLACDLKSGLGRPLLVGHLRFEGVVNPLPGFFPPDISLDAEQDGELHAVAQALVEESTSDRCGRATALHSLSQLLLLYVVRKLIRSGAVMSGLLGGLSHSALKRALFAIHARPGQAWRIEDMAAEACMSRSRFMAVFRQQVGMPPAAYLSRWRLLLAKRALEGGEGVKHVASRAGFGSVASFSRAYVRQFGQSPVEGLSCAMREANVRQRDWHMEKADLANRHSIE